ncbi:hypothetical protein D3C80_887100 [compost metagenome]
MVINHHRQVISEQPIASTNNKVFPRQRRIGLQFTLQAIVKGINRAGLAQTDGGALRAEIQSTAMTIIKTANLLDTTAGAVAEIAQSLLMQVFQSGAVSFVTLGLIDDLAVPVETIVFQSG